MSISEQFVALKEGLLIFDIVSDSKSARPKKVLIVHSEQHVRLSLIFQFNNGN